MTVDRDFYSVGTPGEAGMAADREARAKERKAGRARRADSGEAPSEAGPAAEAGEAKKLFACRRFD